MSRNSACLRCRWSAVCLSPAYSELVFNSRVGTTGLYILGYSYEGHQVPVECTLPDKKELFERMQKRIFSNAERLHGKIYGVQNL